MDDRPQLAASARWLLGPLVFLSGACSLGFEVVWAKQLGVVLGGTTAGIAFVVAIFMGGMALGYAAGGQLAARVRRPLATYGKCEVVLALVALVAAETAPRLEGLTTLPMTFVMAGLLLVPATFLAGVTLPLLVAGTRGSIGAAVGFLYGANTLGAVVGALLSGTVLIGLLGLRGSAHMLAAVGIATGLLAIALGRGSTVSVTKREEPELAAGETQGGGPVAASLRRWQTLACLTGFASLAEEVLWVRALLPQLNSSTYAFSAILAAFLLGLALGAAAAGRLVRARADALRWLCGTQLCAGLFVLFSLEALQLSELVVPGYVGMRHVGGLSAFVSVALATVARAVAALLLPTFMLGFALPLLVALAASQGSSRAGIVGSLAGFNTLGSVFGSLAARFWLLPIWGVSTSVRGMAVLHAIAAGMCMFKRPGAGRFMMPAALLVALALLREDTAPFLGRLALGHKVIFVEEGVQDTTAVVELKGAGGARNILANGISYAGDTAEGKRYMRLLGHLPALHARQQRRGLVICLGTGMTAAALSRHRAFDEIDLIDISPVVYRTLPIFARSNDGILENPRAHIQIEDGRVFLAHAPAGHYDAVTLEPPPPRVAGVATLYSREFYEHARRALTEGGALAQWLPMHGMTDSELRMLARTFQAVFPDAVLYKIEAVEAALLGTKGAGADAATIAHRVDAPGVRDHLRELSPAAPLALPCIARDALRQALGNGPMVTDDHPRIEYFAAGLPPGGESTDRAGEAFMNAMFSAHTTCR